MSTLLYHRVKANGDEVRMYQRSERDFTVVIGGTVIKTDNIGDAYRAYNERR